MADVASLGEWICMKCGRLYGTQHEMGCPMLTEDHTGYHVVMSDAIPPSVRTFETGANRNSDEGKIDFEGALSPNVLWAFGEYMTKHRVLPDGTVRSADNWQNGMPLDSYMQSLMRHVFDLWMIHRGNEAVRPESGELVMLDDALGGIFFNLQGYWHTVLTAPEELTKE
jgi:hypothetical protein